VDLAFFIDVPFTLRCRTSADDADALTALGRESYQKPAPRRHAKGDQPFLTLRMVGVGARRGHRVIKCTRCFLKRNPMLEEVLRSLSRVPFKIHALILSWHALQVYFMVGLIGENSDPSQPDTKPMAASRGTGSTAPQCWDPPLFFRYSP